MQNKPNLKNKEEEKGGAVLCCGPQCAAGHTPWETSVKVGVPSQLSSDHTFPFFWRIQIIHSYGYLLIHFPFYSSEGCPGVSKLFMQPSPPPGVRVKQNHKWIQKRGTCGGWAAAAVSSLVVTLLAWEEGAKSVRRRLIRSRHSKRWRGGSQQTGR